MSIRWAAWSCCPNWKLTEIKQTAAGETYQLFRNCSLAVLNCGSHTDSSKEILERHKNFDINVIRRERGVSWNYSTRPTPPMWMAI